MTYQELKLFFQKYLGNWGSTTQSAGQTAIKTIASLYDGAGNNITSTSNKLDTNTTLAAGSAIIGTVKIDQTTPGTTNGVVINSGTVTTVSTLTSGNVGGFTTLATSNIVMSVAGAYATGDYIGTTTTPQSFTNVVRTSGGTGIIKSIRITDKVVTTAVTMELWLFSATFTAPTDNAAWTCTDAEALTCLGVIPIDSTKWYLGTVNKIYTDDTLSIVIKPAATSLFYALVARGATPTWASLDLEIGLGILQD